MFGFNDKGEFKFNSEKKKEKMVETQIEEEDEEEDDIENPDNIYKEEISPEKVKVLCKKYIDDDEDDNETSFRIMILQDTETKEEFIVFDNFSEFVVRPRKKKD